MYILIVPRGRSRSRERHAKITRYARDLLSRTKACPPGAALRPAAIRAGRRVGGPARTAHPRHYVQFGTKVLTRYPKVVDLFSPCLIPCRADRLAHTIRGVFVRESQ